MAVYEAKFICAELGDTQLDVVRDDWESTLKSKRSKILTQIQTRIPDASTYNDVLAQPAISEYESFVNPSHPKAARALRKRKIKIPAGANDYLTNVANAFAEGGRFETRVTEAKDKFKRNFAAITQAVGDKSQKLGVVTAVMWALLGQYSKIQTFPSDRYEEIARDADMPTNIFKPEYQANVRSAVTQLLNEGIYYAVLAIDAGEDVSTLLSDYNSRLDAFVANTTFLKDTIDSANTFVHIVYEAGVLKAHVKETTL